MYVFDQAFTFFDFGRAAVSAVILFAVIMGLTLIQRRVVSTRVDY